MSYFFDVLLVTVIIIIFFPVFSKAFEIQDNSYCKYTLYHSCRQNLTGRTRKKYYYNYFHEKYIKLLVGTILMSAGTAFFLLPNKLSTGGFSGIATIFYYLLNFNMGVTILVLNAPLFIIACFKIGIKFLSKAIIGTTLLSVFIDIFTQFGVATGDRLLASIYGGIITGIGTSIVLKANASTGGSDLLAIIIKKFKPYFRTGKLIMIIDTIIVILNVIFL